MIRIALAGQPNSGKSTLFNQVAGYRQITSNFPGKTVQYVLSKVSVAGEVAELVDLPGTYSLTSSDDAELEARNYILRGEADVVINVIDATLLGRSLEFTLQLMQLGKPFVICLNMMDETEHKGLKINIEKLSRLLGLPVVPTVASRGKGVLDLFVTALKVARNPTIATPKPPQFSSDVEEAISDVMEILPKKAEHAGVDKKLSAIKLLEQDELFWDKFRDDSGFIKKFELVQSRLEADRGMPSDLVISSERHAIAMAWFEEAVTVTQAKIGLAHKADEIMMHPYLGYLVAAAVLYTLFQFIFMAGSVLQEPLMITFTRYVITPVDTLLGRDTLPGALANGLLQGVAAGLAVNLPYVVPLLIGLAVLEDVGYLPRAAFMLDTFMHRIGLHGKAIFPLLLGYGCSVPAIMATRIMESRRDRVITSTLVLLVPCSGRIIVIFGLVGFYIGMNAAFAILALDLVVIMAVGFVLSRLMPEVTPGLILEIPDLRRPIPKILLQKTWLRLKEFLIIAWPILVASSIILSLMEFYGISNTFNNLLAPLTLNLLGLPLLTGVPLVLSILRKELALIMLSEALDTWDLSLALTHTQMLTFSVFTTFFIPCFTSIGMIGKEIGWKTAIQSALLTLLLATLLATMTRFLTTLIPV
jgi:ferrous iron transport protein B